MPDSCDPVDYIAHQVLLFMGLEFSRQEYWSGLPFPSPGDLPDPGIEPWSALQAGSLPTEPLGKPSWPSVFWVLHPDSTNPGEDGEVEPGMWKADNTTPLYIMDLSIPRFWCPGES